MQDEKNSANEGKTSVIVDVDLNVAGQVEKKKQVCCYILRFFLP